MKTDVTRPKWRERLAARFKSVPRPFIEFDKTGMTVTTWYRDGSETKTELKWSEVNGVVAYKRDCLTVDLICVGFTTLDGGVEVNEEMDGWKTLIDAVPGLLPGTTSKEQWWQKVEQPPFAANPTTLFSK